MSGLIGGGTVSTAFTVVTAGDYFYKINYAGDGNNSPFSSCVEKVGVTIISCHDRIRLTRALWPGIERGRDPIGPGPFLIRGSSDHRE